MRSNLGDSVSDFYTKESDGDSEITMNQLLEMIVLELHTLNYYIMTMMENRGELE